MYTNEYSTAEEVFVATNCTRCSHAYQRQDNDYWYCRLRKTKCPYLEENDKEINNG